MNLRCIFIVPIMLLASVVSADPFRSYHIGNSLTSQTYSHIGYSLEQLTDSRNIDIAVGFHIRCGSQLNVTYNNPNEVCVGPTPPYGVFTNALPNYTWDAITLQPYGDPMNAGISAANGMINLSLQNPSNQAAKIYVMEMWPQGESSDSYATRWNRNYDESIDDYESRWSKQYFLDFTQNLKASNPAKKVGMVLSGEVLYQFDLLAKQGAITGFNSVSQLYGDPYHVTQDGSYLSRLTLFATLYHTSPVGLPVPSNVTFTSEDVKQLQELVWQVVTSNSNLSLVIASDANRDLRVDTLDFNVMANFFGTNTYLNSQGDFSGDGLVNSVDFNLLVSQFGMTNSIQASVVPEPTVLCGFIVIFSLMSHRRFR